MKIALDQESLLELDYDSKIDVIMVKWVNKPKVPWHEILNSYKQLVNCINQYQVPNLLIDSLNNSCNEQGEYKKLLFIQLNLDLAFTNLKK